MIMYLHICYMYVIVWAKVDFVVVVCWYDMHRGLFLNAYIWICTPTNSDAWVWLAGCQGVWVPRKSWKHALLDNPADSLGALLMQHDATWWQPCEPLSDTVMLLRGNMATIWTPAVLWGSTSDDPWGCHYGVSRKDTPPSRELIL